MSLESFFEPLDTATASPLDLPLRRVEPLDLELDDDLDEPNPFTGLNSLREGVISQRSALNIWGAELHDAIIGIRISTSLNDFRGAEAQAARARTLLDRMPRAGRSPNRV